MIAALMVLPVAWCFVRVPHRTVAVLACVLVLETFLIRNLPSDAAGLVQNADEIGILAGLVRVVVLYARGDTAWLRRNDWSLPLLFAAVGLVSSAAHAVNAVPVALGMLQSLKFTLWLLVVRSVPWSPSHALRLVRIVAALSFAFLATGLLGFLRTDIMFDYFLADTPAVLQEVLGRGEAAGLTPFVLPFSHPGGYGWACAVTALASFALFTERRSPTAMAGIGAGVIGVIMSLRRKPLLGIPLAVFGAMGSLTRRQLLWVATTCVAAALAIGVFARDKVDVIVEDTVTSYLDADLDTQVRVAMLYVGMERATARFPLGEGFGRFGSYASILYPSEVYETTGLWLLPGFSFEPDEPNYALDTYWQHLLGEVGWLGTLAMALFMVSLLRRVRRARRNATTPECRTIAFFSLMVLIEALVESIAAPVFESSLQAFFIALALGVTLRLAPSDATFAAGSHAKRPR